MRMRDRRRLRRRAAATRDSSSSSGSDFDVEAKDAAVEAEGDLARGLADAGEDDLLRPGRRRRARGAARPRRRRRRRRRAARGSRPPPGWSWPSSHSRSVWSRPSNASLEDAVVAQSASPSNSSRTACRPPRRSPAAARLRRGARRRYARNGALVRSATDLESVRGAIWRAHRSGTRDRSCSDLGLSSLRPDAWSGATDHATRSSAGSQGVAGAAAAEAAASRAAGPSPVERRDVGRRGPGGHRGASGGSTRRPPAADKRRRGKRER